MKDFELKESPVPDKFDNTMLSHFAKCPRSFYWFMRRVDYKISPPYFAWGRAFGAFLNEWHRLQGKDLEEDIRLYSALGKAQEEWEKDPPYESKPNTWENLEQVAREYTDVYGPTEPWHMVYGKGELGFTLPIPGTEIYYAGSIDAPIEWGSYGILIREDKTTGGYISESFLNQWEHASQVTGYMWAASQVLGEEPFGAYMNIVSKAHRKDYHDKFQRVLVKKPQWSLDRFMEDTVRLVKDVQREWDRWTWPKYGERDQINCSGGMGRSACLYRNLCLLEAEPWDLDEYPFEAEFTWRPPWAPWERSGENE